jgi:ATP-binding cassette subfamily F protein 3
MLLRADITSKKIGHHRLFQDLQLAINAGEKVGLIGRNGVGKTTLFGLLFGSDGDFEGEIIKQRGLRLVMTAQEHFDQQQSVLDYILSGLPEYSELHRIIQSVNTLGHDLGKIQRYTEALERFQVLGYDQVQDRVLGELAAYQISSQQAEGPVAALSGGQKRFMEIAKVTSAQADLALIDEPTNHMDYLAKEAFIGWLTSTPMAALVITHDRDVLRQVSRIIELKDQTAVSFKGNYNDYLQQNSQLTVNQVNQYEVAQRTIERLKKQIAYARSKKSGWSGTADKKNPFVVMEERLTKQLLQLQAEVGRPSFWIDQESASQLPGRIAERYDRYKARNIKINSSAGGARAYELLKVTKLSLGYQEPLFKDLNLVLGARERLRLHGRNGAGKTTLLLAIRQAITGNVVRPVKCFSGHIDAAPRLKLGVYEQEPDGHYLTMGLGEAILEVFRQHGLPVNQQAVRQVMADYLFDPEQDFRVPLNQLSGGQRARFQLIAMLAHRPDLLVLDEPTNHLDLPSIEELEKALQKYSGAILYVSHDSYFDAAIGGEMATLERLEAVSA